MTAHSSGAFFHILVYRCDINFNEVLTYCLFYLTLLLLNTTCPVLANSIDPDLKKPTDLDLHCSLNM